jgi:hypothetical protein
MRRARLLFTCVAVATSLGFATLVSSAALGGCTSFDGAPPEPGADAADEMTAPPPPMEASVDGPSSDAAAGPKLTPIYARGYGSTGDAGVPVTVEATGLAVDPSGGVIVNGTYSGGPIDLGNHPFAAPSGSSDAFLVQLDAMGMHVQSQAFGDQAAQTGGEVVGSAAKLYASFDFDGTINFPSMPISSAGNLSNPNSVTARFGSQLTFGAYYGFLSASALHVTHLALGASDSVIVFGDWTSSIKPQSVASSQTRDVLHPGLVFVRVLSGTAQDIAHTDYCPDGTSCVGNAIASNFAGEALVGGRFMGSINGVDGGAAITTTTDEDAYLMKLDAQLNRQWVASFGGAGAQDVTAIAAVPKTSDFIVAGVFHGSFTAPGKPAIQATDVGADLFVMRIGPTGNVIWAKTFGGNGDDVVRGIAVDGDANIFLVGDFYGPGLTFGTANDVLFNSDTQGRGTRDMFLAWLDGTGKYVYSSAYGTPGDESPIGVGLDGMNDVVVAGSFDEGIDFGSGLVRATGAKDMFVARLMR